MDPSWRILLVDDHAGFRRRLRQFLAQQWTVVGEAEEGGQAVRIAETLHPHIVLMDVQMEPVDGLLACRQIKERCSGVRVVLYSGHERATFPAESLAEADAWIDKADLFQELEETLSAWQPSNARVIR